MLHGRNRKSASTATFPARGERPYRPGFAGAAMSEESGPAEPPERALARDWITIWQSELAGLAADREAQETWQKLLALWGEAAWAVLGAAAGAPPQAREHPDGSTGTAQPPRTRCCCT